MQRKLSSFLSRKRTHAELEMEDFSNLETSTNEPGTSPSTLPTISSTHNTSSTPSSSIDMSSPPSSPIHPSGSNLCSSPILGAVNVSEIDDVGFLLHNMSHSEILNLPPNLKYSLYINHFRPDSSFKFPSRYQDGNNRSCQYQYFVDNPWFVYSKVEDGIFCLPCVLFASKSSLGQFVSEKFNTWSKKHDRFSRHNKAKYHELALVKMEALQSSVMDPCTSIENRLKNIADNEIANNRQIIKCMAEAILLCGKQCIALRGHRDDTTSTSSNKGNFLALLDYSIKSGNSILEKHLREAKKNAIYTSKVIQNDIIECIGDHIRNGILDEVKEVKYYSILCDEVTDVSVKEQVSFVIRYVDNACNIREEFLDFIHTDRTTGEVLAGKIMDFLRKYNIDFKYCRGQGYDGASNMSSSINGVQGRLSQENKKAVYMHCNSHILNLCIVKASSLAYVRNMNTTVTETANFFANSSKRQEFLEKFVGNSVSTTKVKDLCRTRWIYRHEAYENFFKLYKYLVQVMEAVVSHDDQFGDMNWDGKTVIAASGLLTMYKSFSFILSFIVTMNAMTIIKPISIKLQSKNNDIAKAFSEVESVMKELLDIRSNDSLIHAWYMQAEKLAKDLNVTPTSPRTAGHQQHRDNIEHDSPEVYYRRCIIFPLLDNLSTQMKDRFSNTQQTVASLLNLIPSILCNNSSASFPLERISSLYEDDLPSPSLLPTELWRWKAKWSSCDDQPSTLIDSLKKCDEDYFPNIYVLLRIACTLPVTSCENERSHNTLKNLKTFLRNAMGQDRLSSLALMHIHHSKDVSLDKVVDTFKLKSSRRIAL